MYVIYITRFSKLKLVYYEMILYWALKECSSCLSSGIYSKNSLREFIGVSAVYNMYLYTVFTYSGISVPNLLKLDNAFAKPAVDS